jgi:hypothetical protein
MRVSAALPPNLQFERAEFGSSNTSLDSPRAPGIGSCNAAEGAGSGLFRQARRSVKALPIVDKVTELY